MRILIRWITCYHAVRRYGKQRRRQFPTKLGPVMIEVVRTNDLVHLSWCQAVLKGEGIESVVVDMHTSVIEGSIGAIPRRLLVSDDDETAAKSILKAARGEVE